MPLCYVGVFPAGIMFPLSNADEALSQLPLRFSLWQLGLLWLGLLWLGKRRK